MADGRPEIAPRETVILAEDPGRLVTWYRDLLGFSITREFSEDYTYTNLETAGGLRIGIADAREMGITPGDRENATVVPQIEVEDVAAFLSHVTEGGGSTTFGPSFDEKGQFSYGAFSDPEGNRFWVVDRRCP